MVTQISNFGADSNPIVDFLNKPKTNPLSTLGQAPQGNPLVDYVSGLGKPKNNPLLDYLGLANGVNYGGGTGPLGEGVYGPPNPPAPPAPPSFNPLSQYQLIEGTPAFRDPLPMNQPAPTTGGDDFGIGGMPELPSYGGSLDDFLEQARKLYSSSMESAENSTAAREAALRKNFRKSDKRLSEMYGGMQEFLNRQAGDAVNRSQNMQDKAAQVADDTAQVSQDAYSDALAQQVAARQALGLEDVDFRDAETAQATEMQSAVGRAADSGQSAVKELSRKGRAQSDLLSSSAASTAFRGANQRADLDTDLQMYLARLQDEQAQTSSSYEKAIADAAMRLHDTDYSRWSDQYNRQFQADQAGRQNSQWEQQFNQDQFRWEQEQMAAQQAAQAKAQGSQEAPPGIMLQQQLQQYGVPPEQISQLVPLYQRIARNRQGVQGGDKPGFMQDLERELQRMGIEPSPGIFFGAEQYFDNFNG